MRRKPGLIRCQGIGSGELNVRRSVRVMSICLITGLLGGMGAAHGQVDPLAGILAPPKPAAKASGAPASAASVLAPPASAARAPGQRSGFLAVEQAVGGSYAAAQTRGVVSMASLRTLPRTASPFTVPLKVTNARAFAAKPRIAIPTYALAIVQHGSIRASAAGTGSDINPRASSLSTILIGVTDDMASRLAEEASADLVRRLVAIGVDVVPQSELLANADMARLRALGAKDKGLNDWDVYGAASAPLYAGHPLDSGLAGPGAAIALTDVAFGLNAVVLQPYLALDYERLGTSGRSNYTSSASVSAELRFRIASGGAQGRYATGRGKGSGPWGSLITDGAGTDEPFGVMFEIDDKSDDPAISSTFARLGMGSLYRQSKYYGVEVSPDRYETLARAAFQGLNAAIVAEIQKARG